MNFTPKKSLGQNFLTNQGILEKIADAAALSKNDTAVEIGPGTGNLTQKLLERAGTVIAIEKDRRLIADLASKFAGYKNFRLVEGDALTFDPGAYGLEPGTYKIAANIPYYITSHFIRRTLEEWPKPELIVLTVQKEVARRMVAKPPHMNLLALSVQYYATPEIVGLISRGSFRPMPKVDSAIVRLVPRQKIPNQESAGKMFALIRAGFAGKRKQLLPALAKRGLASRDDALALFAELGIPIHARAENLSLEQWITLADRIRY